MQTNVKRNYSSTLRASQARETRRAIVTAASELFVSEGFGRTTIDEIAAAAGVSRKTVFTSVGGKAEILRLAVDWAVVGDDEPIPLHKRPEVEQLKQETDPVALVEGWVEMGVRISARVAGIHGALIVAAGIDDDARVLFETAQAHRLAGARGFTGGLARIGGLRDGLSADAAADIAWLHSDPVFYQSLVLQRGWSQRRFKTWLIDTMQSQLLG